MSRTIDADERPTLSPLHVAEQIGVGETTALNLMRSGKLPAFRIGRFWRTSPRLLREYIAAAAVVPAGRGG